MPYGIDIQCVDDLDPSFGQVRGTRAVAQALARRLGTPRGSLFYDGEYGLDLRQFVNADFSAARAFQIGASIEAECLKDERVRTCAATVSYDEEDEALSVFIDAVSAEGPFRLVLAVSAVTVEILGGA